MDDIFMFWISIWYTSKWKGYWIIVPTESNRAW